MQHKILVVTTQTPESRAEIIGVADGKTAQIIQALTDCGLIKMHRNKLLQTNEKVDEKQIAKDNLMDGGWLIITGHGNSGAETVKGNYRTDDEPDEILDIECSARDYVNLILQAKALKEGSHLNILLSVCYGAKGLDGIESFAEQLGNIFSEKGISTDIIASVGPVGRIGNYSKNDGDVAGERLKFRADKKNIRVIHTALNGISSISSPADDYYITRNQGIVTGKVLRDPDTELMQVLSKLNLGISDHVLAANFSDDAETAEKKIAKAGVIIRKSSIPNALTITYHKKGGVVHTRIHLERDLSGRMIINDSDAGSIKKIVDAAQLRTANASSGSLRQAKGGADPMLFGGGAVKRADDAVSRPEELVASKTKDGG